MAKNSSTLLFLVVHIFCILSSSQGRISPSLGIRAVNLGGWLVTEGWIKPSLFDKIPNKDFLDGTQLQFLSVTTGKYLRAELGGGSIIVANGLEDSRWETFKVWRVNETSFNFRVFLGQFIGVDTAGNGGQVVAVSTTPGNLETFQIAKSETVVTADYGGSGEWGDDDPSVFMMNFVSKLAGEFQVTNGYGPVKAPQVMKDHWSGFIKEDDFKFISENGLNAVRIPVGWWIASDPSPPPPYVGGSLKALDDAFVWARKYKLHVIIDLHAAPGSQNGFEHSSSRDGSLEWGKTDDNILQTVGVIDFLTARYAKNPSLYAVELMNEPLYSGVPLDLLTKYYQAGYNAVRKYTSTAYVVLSNRIGPVKARKLFHLASGMTGAVVDVHYYNLFIDIFNGLTVQQNIDYIKVNRTADLNYLTTSNGPLIFVGEWVAEWEVIGASKEDYQTFAKAQMDVNGNASFGWAYWTLQNLNDHWNLTWMIDHGYISL